MPMSPSQHTTKDTTAASKSFIRRMENERLKMQQNIMIWPPTHTDPMNLEMEKFESSLHDVDAPPWLFVLFWFLRLEVRILPSSRPSSASWRRLGSLPTVGAFPVWKLNANKLVHYSVKQARYCNTRLKERNACLPQQCQPIPWRSDVNVYCWEQILAEFHNRLTIYIYMDLGKKTNGLNVYKNDPMATKSKAFSLNFRYLRCVRNVFNTKLFQR